MNWLLGRVAQLEKTRSELIAAARTSDGDPNDATRKIIEAVGAMTAVEFEQVWDNPGDEEGQARAVAAAQRRGCVLWFAAHPFLA
jgi:hypothetical protein